MDLQQFVTRLQSRHPQMSILQRISRETRRVTENMLDRLLESLQEDMNLSQSIGVIGHLRRMQVLTEEELRMLFLAARHRHFEVCCANLARANRRDSKNDGKAARNPPGTVLASTRLKHTMDTARSCLVDIVTQYQAIFMDNLGTTTSATTTSPSSLDYGSRPGRGSAAASSAVLHSFLIYAVDRLVLDIQSLLAQIDDAAVIGHTFSQAMHLGVALGRKGVDLRVLLAGPFFNRIKTLACKHWTNGAVAYRQELQVNGVQNLVDRRHMPGVNSRVSGESSLMDWYREIDASILSASQLITRLSVVRAVSPSADGRQQQVPNVIQPPQLLLQFPALAAVTNQILLGLGVVRAMPCATLYTSLLESYVDAMEQVIVATRDAYNAREDDVPGKPDADPGVDTTLQEYNMVVMRVLRDIWIPFLLGCIYDTTFSQLKGMETACGKSALEAESVRKRLYKRLQ